MTSILTLRVTRRAVGIAQLSDEILLLVDGRHLTSRTDRAVAAVEKYVAKLVAVTKPAWLVLDVPSRLTGATTQGVLAALQTLAERCGISLLTIGVSDVLAAYGTRTLRNRRELRELVRAYWPELARMTGKVEPYAVDAAAAALYAECRLAFEPRPT